MERWRWFLGAALIAACGGKSGKHDAPAEIPAPETGGMAGASSGGMAQAGASSGGMAQAGASSGGMAQAGASSGGMAQAGAGATTTYIPTNPLVSPQGDGSLTGGSIEGGLSNGWDLCYNVRREFRLRRESVDASDGEQFLLFDSSLVCPSEDGCTSTAGDLPLIMWPKEDFPAGEARHLYFDIVNFTTAAPSGVLVVGMPYTSTTTDLCKIDEELALIPLADLAVTSDWGTRCVTITPSESMLNFGVYVSDGTFKIGLDAFRFGPPCRE